MKVCLLTECYYPYVCGVSAVVKLIYDGLKKIGHNPYIVTFRLIGAKYPEDDHIILLDGTPLVPHLSAYIIKHTDNVVKMLQEYHFDIIHSHGDYSLNTVAKKLAKKDKIPIIHTWHTLWNVYYKYQIPVFGRLVGLVNDLLFPLSIARRADLRIVPTEKVISRLNKLGINENIKVLPSAIDVYKFLSWDQTRVDEYKKAYNPDNKKVILYFGRVSKEKGIKALTKWTIEYLLNHDDAIMVVAGSGNYSAVLAKKYQKLKLNDKVKFTGSIESEDSMNLYRLGDVFVTNSHMETQGLTYTEAMACGIPVLEAKDLCLKGVIEDGKNGFLFENKDEYFLKLDYVLHNDIKNVIKESMETLLNYYPETYVQKTAEIYEKCINAKKEELLKKKLDN